MRPAARAALTAVSTSRWPPSWSADALSCDRRDRPGPSSRSGARRSGRGAAPRSARRRRSRRRTRPAARGLRPGRRRTPRRSRAQPRQRRARARSEASAGRIDPEESGAEPPPKRTLRPMGPLVVAGGRSSPPPMAPVGAAECMLPSRRRERKLRVQRAGYDAAGRSGGTGRRDGLKIRCPQGRQGSNPCSGTKRSATKQHGSVKRLGNRSLGCYDRFVGELFVIAAPTHFYCQRLGPCRRLPETARARSHTRRYSPCTLGWDDRVGVRGLIAPSRVGSRGLPPRRGSRRP